MTAAPQRSGDLTIDIHAHALVPAAADLVQHEWAPEKDEFLRFGGERSNAYNRRAFAELQPRMTDVELRIRDMDRQGVMYQAVAIAPPQYYYWTSPDLGAEAARLINDSLAELVDARPDRLVALGTLPMHNPPAAVEELDRIADRYGFPGVSINPSAQGVDYDDPRYETFWRRVAERDLLVVLHPNGFCQGERLTDYYMINVVGNPLETTIALAHIVLGGIVERHPGIKILAVHGGGYLTFYADRMDHAAAQRDDVAYNLSRPPSWYLKQLYFDTVVHGDGLEYLIDRVDAGHVCMGSDYPYDMGHADPVGHVNGIGGLTGEQRRAILGGNAARLLGLKVQG
jgi:aminocarboxymuconate-semialdehyde decarboxylase